MPFKSKAQAKWAFANKQPWAQKWADLTPNVSALPDRALPPGPEATKARMRNHPHPALRRLHGGK